MGGEDVASLKKEIDETRSQTKQILTQIKNLQQTRIGLCEELKEAIINHIVVLEELASLSEASLNPWKEVLKTFETITTYQPSSECRSLLQPAEPQVAVEPVAQVDPKRKACKIKDKDIIPEEDKKEKEIKEIKEVKKEEPEKEEKPKEEEKKEEPKKDEEEKIEKPQEEKEEKKKEAEQAKKPQPPPPAGRPKPPPPTVPAPATEKAAEPEKQEPQTQARPAPPAAQPGEFFQKINSTISNKNRNNNKNILKFI